MNVVIIDCFDSFTYNLYQLVGSLGADPIPVTSNNPVEIVEKKEPDRIILSPGPGTPLESGVCADVIKAYIGEVPILGVCLGHQTIIHTLGGTISRMKRPVHGMTSEIRTNGEGIFQSIPDRFTAARYHSLTAEPHHLPSELEVVATAEDDGAIMAVSHRKHPVYGLQFHPESIMTPHGRTIMKNFLQFGGEC
ncbi:MAG: aminodeoxychorismate/anthranilate synthase component II [Methanomicrobiales archaeon]|nr:aminodeoxychorismate/anthranilate synthase component II [Methanomicrobiales archaeon]